MIESRRGYVYSDSKSSHNYGFTIPTSGYDNEDRLVTYNRTSGLSQSWNLSTVGDWNSITTNGTAQSRTHGPTHELLNAAGQAVTTDVKGNITLIPAALRSNGQALALTYDFNNRMVTADVGNNGSIEVSHKYDALGRRVSRTEASTTTVFALSGQQVICDYASGAAPATSTYRYVYASYIDEPIMRRTTSGGAQLYYHRNQQYSIVAMTNSSGAVQERYAYTAYGVPTIANASGTVLTTSAINNRYMYTGREWDNVTGQYYYRARMYDAGLGRFCSRDPIEFEGSQWGLYEYVQSNPLNSTDPSGLIREEYLDLRNELENKLAGMCESCICDTKCQVSECQNDANRIANAIMFTFDNNHSRNMNPFAEAYAGHWCYEWACGFKGAAIAATASSCFSFDVKESGRTGLLSMPIHQWLEITLNCGGADQKAYVHDLFGSSSFTPDEPPAVYGPPRQPSRGPNGPIPDSDVTPVTPYNPDASPVQNPVYF